MIDSLCCGLTGEATLVGPQSGPSGAADGRRRGVLDEDHLLSSRCGLLVLRR